VVDALVALRGVDRVAVVAPLSELGDVSRFDSPSPSSWAIWGWCRVGTIRASVEVGAGQLRERANSTHGGCWWSRRGAIGSRRARPLIWPAKPKAKAIAWQAQKRLCDHYRALIAAGKNKKVVCVTIARELVGSLWDIVYREMPKARAA
jgi:hypothetical protein